ncbi:hypothetical protein ACFGY2_11605 [Pasteurella multocida]
MAILEKFLNQKKKAEQWKEQNGQLAFVTEVTYNNKKEIIKVDDQDFDDFVESISDEIGTPEFIRVKKSLMEEWAFTDLVH